MCGYQMATDKNNIEKCHEAQQTQQQKNMDTQIQLNTETEAINSIT